MMLYELLCATKKQNSIRDVIDCTLVNRYPYPEGWASIDIRISSYCGVSIAADYYPIT